MSSHVFLLLTFPLRLFFLPFTRTLPFASELLFCSSFVPVSSPTSPLVSSSLYPHALTSASALLFCCSFFPFSSFSFLCICTAFLLSFLPCNFTLLYSASALLCFLPSLLFCIFTLLLFCCAFFPVSSLLLLLRLQSSSAVLSFFIYPPSSFACICTPVPLFFLPCILARLPSVSSFHFGSSFFHLSALFRLHQASSSAVLSSLCPLWHLHFNSVFSFLYPRSFFFCI